MTRLLIAMALLAGLAACGADGTPERPEPRPGVALSGTVSVGVQGTL